MTVCIGAFTTLTDTLVTGLPMSTLVSLCWQVGRLLWQWQGDVDVDTASNVVTWVCFWLNTKFTVITCLCSVYIKHNTARAVLDTEWWWRRCLWWYISFLTSLSFSCKSVRQILWNFELFVNLLLISYLDFMILGHLPDMEWIETCSKVTVELDLLYFQSSSRLCRSRLFYCLDNAVEHLV